MAPAAEQSTAVRGVNEYRVQADGDGPHEPLPAALVIGFGHVTTSRIQHGIGVLGSLVAADRA